jgi:hypothetical protein
MADYFDSKKFGCIMAVGPFTIANATTEESDSELAYGQDSYAAMPADGSVVAISVYANAELEGGSATIRAHSAGTELAATGYPAPVVNTTNTQVSYASVRPGAVTFSAGDKLGLSITSTTTLDPTDSLDIDGWLFVQIEPS